MNREALGRDLPSEAAKRDELVSAGGQAFLELIRRVAPSSMHLSRMWEAGSTLVDGLLGAGYGGITVLDLAPAALARAQERLGKRTTQVRWIVADVLDAPLLAASCAVWHDRAVFHFLTEFGASFLLLDSMRENHRTPNGLTQAFVYCLCRVGG